MALCVDIQSLLRKVAIFISHNGGDWRSKSLALPLMLSTTPDGFYFANCVLPAAISRIINNNSK